MITVRDTELPWRGLALWQPWASLMATGHKRVETRSWGTKFRGLVVIHAAKKKPPLSEYHPQRPAAIPPGTVEVMMQALGIADFDTLPRGAILGVAKLVDCVQLTGEFAPTMGCPACAAWADGPDRYRTQEHVFGDYHPGRWAWTFADMARLETPYPWRAYQGLWKVPELTINWLRGCTFTDARIGAV